MKGKNTFSILEIKQLEELIILRNKTESSKQRTIRDKMRKLGFFGKDDWGITDMQVKDLNILIKSGRINVIGINTSNDAPKSTFKESVLIPTPIKIKADSEDVLDLKLILRLFSENCFNPKIDNETKIHDSPGNYIICLKKNSFLPKIIVNPQHSKFENQDVIYTGIASKSLRKRDFKQHFKGNNAGRSTLRKSLGCLFGYKLIPRDNDPTTGKTKFSFTDEQELTQWMLDNLIMFFVPTSNYKAIELELISFLNPPLNLMGNNNVVNSEFRKKLSSLRTRKTF